MDSSFEAAVLVDAQLRAVEVKLGVRAAARADALHGEAARRGGSARSRDLHAGLRMRVQAGVT